MGFDIEFEIVTKYYKVRKKIRDFIFVWLWNRTQKFGKNAVSMCSIFKGFSKTHKIKFDHFWCLEKKIVLVMEGFTDLEIKTSYKIRILFKTKETFFK